MGNSVYHAGPIAAAALGLLFAATPAAAQSGGGTQSLKCENAVNPRGVLTLHPTLSWTLVPNAIQRGYQILVASSPEKLKADEADLWDTGLVRTDRTTARYQGKPLTSMQRCYWKIRIWTSYYQNGAYTEPSTWEMGVLPFGEDKKK